MKAASIDGPFAFWQPVLSLISKCIVMLNTGQIKCLLVCLLVAATLPRVLSIRSRESRELNFNMSNKQMVETHE